MFATLLSGSAIVLANAEQRQIAGIDLVVGFQEMAGQRVVVSDCRIGGTTSAFVRCETSNGSASYAVDAKSLSRDDFRWALENCPTGSRLKPHCTVTIEGEVDRYSMPRLKNSKIVRTKK